MQLLIINTLFCFILCSCTFMAHAQSFAEWWQQKKTRIQYLEQQVAALEAFKNTLEKGCAIQQLGIDTIEELKEEDYQLHYTNFKSQGVLHPVGEKIPEVSGIIALHIRLINEIDGSIDDWKHSPWLSAEELSDIETRYNMLGALGMDDLRRLDEVTSDGVLNMSDGERFKAIMSIGCNVDASLSFVLRSKERTNRLIEARRREAGDIDNLKSILP